MAVKKIYAVDSMTVTTVVTTGSTPTTSRSTTRSSTEHVGVDRTGTVLPGGTVQSTTTTTSIAFYVFDNAIPAGEFTSARFVIPIQSDTASGWARLISTLNARPAQGTTDAQSLLNISVGAPQWNATNDGVSYRLNIPSLGQLQRIASNGIRVQSGVDNSAFVYMHTARSAESLRPYIEYTFIDANEPPVISALSPKDTIVDSDSPNIFTWSYSQVLNAPQTHVDIQQLYQGEWLSIASKTPWTAQQYTVPAGTLKPGGTAWRVRAYCNAGNTVSAWASANVTIVALQSEPPVVGIVTPKDIIIDGDSPNLFTWTYEQPGGSPQSHVDIQYQYGGVWQSIADKTPLAEQKYTVPAGTLQAGQTRWRMRAYCNGGNIVSEWDEALVTVKAKPGDPVITGAIGIPRPTLSWTHDGQQAGYQIQVAPVGLSDVVVDSGTVYSGSGYWQCPEYLADDDYTISLRIVSVDQVWSNWVHVAVTVRNVPGEPIRLTSEPTRDYGTRLTWETDGSYPQYLILRNGKAVGYATGSSYVDYFSVGSAAYAVRGLSGNYYTDSNVRNACVKVPHAAISSVDPISWLKLEVRRGGRPVHEVSMTPNAAYLRFEGRSRPHRQTDDSGYADVTHSFTFTFRDRESYLKLCDLVNKTVIYKDCMEELIIGNLDSVEASLDRVYDFKLTITETDFDEVVYV